MHADIHILAISTSSCDPVMKCAKPEEDCVQRSREKPIPRSVECSDKHFGGCIPMNSPSKRQKLQADRQQQQQQQPQQQLKPDSSLPPKDLLSPGDLVKDRWRVIRKLGGGGFGEIYEAVDTKVKHGSPQTESGVPFGRLNEKNLCLNCLSKLHVRKLPDLVQDDRTKRVTSAGATDSGIGVHQYSSEFQRINSAGTSTSGSLSSHRTALIGAEQNHAGSAVGMKLEKCNGDLCRAVFGQQDATTNISPILKECYWIGEKRRACEGCGVQLATHLRTPRATLGTCNENCVSSDSGISTTADAYDYRVAIKVESNRQPRQVLRMEVAVLRRLQGKPNVCQLFGCGKNTRFNYMVMTLQGKNLAELRRAVPSGVFSLSTAFRVILQCLDALYTLHEVGFLHRDVKPSNFAIQRQKSQEEPNGIQVTILDFGLARPYTVGGPGTEVRNPRPVAGFRGTVRYASIHAHEHRDLSRRDDLWSLFYMFVEFVAGQLPWRRIRDKELVGQMKISLNHIELAVRAGIPAGIAHFWVSHLESLEYKSKPEYDILKKTLSTWIDEHGVRSTDYFDWERQPISVQTEDTLLPKVINENMINKESRQLENGTEGKQTQEVIFSHTMRPGSSNPCLRSDQLPDGKHRAQDLGVSSKLPPLTQENETDARVMNNPHRMSTTNDRVVGDRPISRVRSEHAIAEELEPSSSDRRELKQNRTTCYVDALTEASQPNGTKKSQDVSGKIMTKSRLSSSAACVINTDLAGKKSESLNRQVRNATISHSVAETTSSVQSIDQMDARSNGLIDTMKTVKKIHENGDFSEIRLPRDEHSKELRITTPSPASICINEKKDGEKISDYCSNTNQLAVHITSGYSTGAENVCMDSASREPIETTNLSGNATVAPGSWTLPTATNNNNPRAKIHAIIQNLLARRKAEAQISQEHLTADLERIVIKSSKLKQLHSGDSSSIFSHSRPRSSPASGRPTVFHCEKAEKMPLVNSGISLASLNNEKLCGPENVAPQSNPSPPHALAVLQSSFSVTRMSMSSCTEHGDGGHHTFLKVPRKSQWNLNFKRPSVQKQSALSDFKELDVPAERKGMGTNTCSVENTETVTNPVAPVQPSTSEATESPTIKPTPLPRKRRTIYLSSSYSEQITEPSLEPSKNAGNSSHPTSTSDASRVPCSTAVTKCEPHPDYGSMAYVRNLENVDYRSKLITNKRRQQLQNKGSGATPIGPVLRNTLNSCHSHPFGNVSKESPLAPKTDKQTEEFQKEFIESGGLDSTAAKSPSASRRGTRWTAVSNPSENKTADRKVRTVEAVQQKTQPACRSAGQRPNKKVTRGMPENSPSVYNKKSEAMRRPPDYQNTNCQRTLSAGSHSVSRNADCSDANKRAPTASELKTLIQSDCPHTERRGTHHTDKKPPSPRLRSTLVGGLQSSRAVENESVLSVDGRKLCLSQSWSSQMKPIGKCLNEAIHQFSRPRTRLLSESCCTQQLDNANSSFNAYDHHGQMKLRVVQVKTRPHSADRYGGNCHSCQSKYESNLANSNKLRVARTQLEQGEPKRRNSTSCNVCSSQTVIQTQKAQVPNPSCNFSRVLQHRRSSKPNMLLCDHQQQHRA